MFGRTKSSIGLDIGSSAVKAVELTSSRGAQQVTWVGSEPVQPDVRWDVYGLGATMYAILTGKVPHQDSLSQRLETSPSLEERLRVYRELDKAARNRDAAS